MGKIFWYLIIILGFIMFYNQSPLIALIIAACVILFVYWNYAKKKKKEKRPEHYNFFGKSSINPNFYGLNMNNTDSYSDIKEEILIKTEEEKKLEQTEKEIIELLTQ